MNLPASLQDQPLRHTAAQSLADSTRQTVVTSTEAANDSAVPDERDPDSYRNPLWLIAVAGACVFAAMAALLALG
jgi:hypothetical protein